MTRIPQALGKVAVLYGGGSAERQISLQSGKAVLEGLLRGGIDAHGVDVTPQIVEQLAKGAFDRAFIMLHGRGGEDGVMQGALELLKLPYTGSGIIGSALGMDKYRCKLLWRGLGLPTPDFCLLKDEEDLATAARLGFPLMVKPVHEGSSIGMNKVDNVHQLSAAWDKARQYDGQVMAEKWILGSEYTVGILGETTLPLIKLETPRSFYDYTAKYDADSTRYICPCGLQDAVEKNLRKLSMEAFKAVGASGWGRVDLMCDEKGKPWLIEVNTVPGMTDHSLVPMAAKQAGISFDQLVGRILQLTLD